MNKFHDLKGEQKEQLLIVCNQYGKKLGLATRLECHQGKGITHLAFMAFLKNKEGKIILTKRSKNKSLWSGFWDAAVVSHVLSGETPQIAAARRSREELGIDIKFKDLGAFYYQAGHGKGSENEYCHVLTGSTLENIHPNPVEIDQVILINLEDLTADIKINPGKYTPWLKKAISKFKTNGL